MIASPGRITLSSFTIGGDYERRQNARPDSARGAYAQRLPRPAGRREAAARGARSDEVGPDEREQPADAHPVPALARRAREASPGALRGEPRQDDEGAADSNRRLRPAFLGTFAAHVPQA